MNEISVFWFRRDLRLTDNTALYQALSSSKNVLPIFIFDENIIKELPENDPRLSFIYENLNNMNETLKSKGASLLVLRGNPIQVWKELLKKHKIKSVYVNKDYEPYAQNRDKEIKNLLFDNQIEFKAFKDQVIFEENEILKKDGNPYTVFTPYKNKWLDTYKSHPAAKPINYNHLTSEMHLFPSMDKIGIKKSSIKVQEYNFSHIKEYHKTRDFPYLDSTSYLSPHLRFGTLSIREIVTKIKDQNPVFLSELIWREFFMQILFHFPKVVSQNFKPKYDNINWLNNNNDFKKWCDGKTGYPLVDAGMRQLNQTGYMHNRVRMVTAGFLCKHLLIDWKWGEAYFAKKLLDYELSSNNGNWQWAAGTGCDAAPYFRIFNPIEQLKKFDPDHIYIQKWIPEFNKSSYPKPMIDHKFARTRALEAYKLGLQK